MQGCSLLILVETVFLITMLVCEDILNININHILQIGATICMIAALISCYYGFWISYRTKAKLAELKDTIHRKHKLSYHFSKGAKITEYDSVIREIIVEWEDYTVSKISMSDFTEIEKTNIKNKVIIDLEKKTILKPNN